MRVDIKAYEIMPIVSIWVRLISAPHGTKMVSATVPKKLLQMACIEDCYTSAKGSTYKKIYS